MTIRLSSSETLIHYEMIPVGVCSGKDKAISELNAFRANPPDSPVTYKTMIATWTGNVTCECCKSYIASRRRKKK